VPTSFFISACSATAGMPGAISWPDFTSCTWLCQSGFSASGRVAKRRSLTMYSTPMSFACFVLPSKIVHWITSSLRIAQ